MEGYGAFSRVYTGCIQSLATLLTTLPMEISARFLETGVSHGNEMVNAAAEGFVTIVDNRSDLE
jgi:hypothetical protein